MHESLDEPGNFSIPFGNGEYLFYKQLVKSPAEVRAFVINNPDVVARLCCVFESGAGINRDPVLSRAFVERYAGDPAYNSSAYFIGQRIGAPVQRLAEPPRRVRVASGVLTIANPVCFYPLEHGIENPKLYEALKLQFCDD